MNVHKVETVLAEDGILILKGLPFRAGDQVEAIVIERPKIVSSQVLSEELAYLQSISSVMNEWESAADELAYQDL
jgi:hypothetical protein